MCSSSLWLTYLQVVFSVPLARLATESDRRCPVHLLWSTRPVTLPRRVWSYASPTSRPVLQLFHWQRRTWMWNVSQQFYPQPLNEQEYRHVHQYHDLKQEWFAYLQPRLALRLEWPKWHSACCQQEPHSFQEEWPSLPARLHSWDLAWPPLSWRIESAVDWCLRNLDGTCYPWTLRLWWPQHSWHYRS